jgi:hypothetical protein
VGKASLLTLQLVSELYEAVNMAAKLENLTKEEQQSVCFVGRRCTKWTNSSANVFSVWGQCSVSLSYVWVD